MHLFLPLPRAHAWLVRRPLWHSASGTELCPNGLPRAAPSHRRRIRATRPWTTSSLLGLPPSPSPSPSPSFAKRSISVFDSQPRAALVLCRPLQAEASTLALWRGGRAASARPAAVARTPTCAQSAGASCDSRCEGGVSCRSMWYARALNSRPLGRTPSGGEASTVGSAAEPIARLALRLRPGNGVAPERLSPRSAYLLLVWSHLGVVCKRGVSFQGRLEPSFTSIDAASCGLFCSLPLFLSPLSRCSHAPKSPSGARLLARSGLGLRQPHDAPTIPR